MREMGWDELGYSAVVVRMDGPGYTKSRGTGRYLPYKVPYIPLWSQRQQRDTLGAAQPRTYHVKVIYY